MRTATAPAVLPAVAVAHDPAAMHAVLAPLLGVPAHRFSVAAVEPLDEKPGQRCIVRYRLNVAGSARNVVGKFYRRPEVADRVRGWTSALARDIGGLPAPLALRRDLGLLVMEHAAGRDLRHALEGCDEVAVRSAASWLARLHATGTPPGLPPKPLAHEVRKGGEYAADVLRALGRRRGAPASRAHGAVRRLAARSADPALGVVHRDFYYANLLWDGGRLSVVDFDALAVGPLALDVGHFLAHLQVLGLRRHGSALAYRTAAAQFTAAYLRSARLPPDPRLVRAGRLLAVLKLASIEVSRRGCAWRAETQRLLRLAEPRMHLPL